MFFALPCVSLQGLDLEGLMDQLAAGQEAHHLTGDADLQEVEAGAEALMTAKAPSPVVLMGWAAFQVGGLDRG